MTKKTAESAEEAVFQQRRVSSQRIMFLPGHLVARYICSLAPLNLFTRSALLCSLCSLAPFTGCSLPSLPRGLVKFINMCSRCKRWNKCSFHLHQKHALILSKSHWTKKLWNYGFRTRFNWRRPGIVLDTYIHCIIRHGHSGPNVSLPSIGHTWRRSWNKEPAISDGR